MILRPPRSTLCPFFFFLMIRRPPRSSLFLYTTLFRCGIAVMHDPALAESLATRRIVLENCPSSNLATGALAKQIGKADASLADHPLAKLLDRGSLVTLSTDDPAMFATDLLTEYSRAASLGL